jgi:hypothetical protein
MILDLARLGLSWVLNNWRLLAGVGLLMAAFSWGYQVAQAECERAHSIQLERVIEGERARFHHDLELVEEAATASAEARVRAEATRYVLLKSVPGDPDCRLDGDGLRELRSLLGMSGATGATNGAVSTGPRPDGR